MIDGESRETSFQVRLARAVDNYRNKQGSDGGWGEGRFEGAASSIVNTVEVLAVLRAGGVRYEDVVVQDALGYLKGAVFSHPLQERPYDPVEPPHTDGRPADEARGEYTRYCAWGIAGLTLYKDSRHDDTLADAQFHCVEWLKDHMWTNAGHWAKAQTEQREILSVGGWGETPDDEYPSLLSTSAAISGLARMCPRHRARLVPERLVGRARKAISALARHPDGSHQMTFWPAMPGDPESDESASNTAMAVISLAGGDEEDRRYASEGARWLLSCKETWEGQVEYSTSVPDANWRHMTFSLGLRAVLRGANLPSSDPEMSPVVGHLNALWRDEDDEWAHGLTEVRPSPSGSYAVVAAYEAMANAWPFDAQRQILEATSAARRSGEPARLHAHVDLNGVTVTTPPDAAKVRVALPPKLAEMLLFVAQQRDRDGRYGSRSMRVQGLAQKFDVEPESIKRYAREISALVKQEARKNGITVGDIVRISKDVKRNEKRVRIHVERITFAGEDPEA